MAEQWGIALGGGGVPGVAAHLGVLHALRSESLVPQVCVGTSAGGLVAGALAAGAELGYLVRGWSTVMADPWRLWLAEAETAVHILRPSPTPGLLDLRPVLSLVSQLSSRGQNWLTQPVARWRGGYGVTLSDLTACRPFVVAAAWDDSAVPTLSTEQALVATAAFPGVFSGVRTADGHLLADGGVYDMLPVEACRRLGARRVVAVRIGSGEDAVPSDLTTLDLLHIVVARLLRLGQEVANPDPPDVLIDVPTSGGLLSTGDFAANFLAGVRAAQDVVDRIREVLVDAQPASA